MVDRSGDAFPQMVGHVVLALAGDHLAQLCFEVERLEARRAVVEVAHDLAAPDVGQLPVQVVVQPMHRLPTVETGRGVLGRLRAPLVLRHPLSTDP
jgi:hypothetical protein